MLVPPARDRDAHAAGAVLALGVSLANYLVGGVGAADADRGRVPPHRDRGAAPRAALALPDRSGGDPGAAAHGRLRSRGAPEWLLDTWLLRIERALDLEAEHGAYLDDMIAGMPTVQRLLRGDERIGWELRLAHDLAQDPSQYEPAATMFARCAHAVEAGGVPLAWSAAAAAAGAPAAVQLDLHWLAATSNPTGTPAPWLRLAQSLLGAGRRAEGFTAACRGVAASAANDRAAAITDLAPAWRAAGLPRPIDGDLAFDAGLEAASEDRLDLAVHHLRWAAAVEPGNAKRAQSLAVALGRLGRGLEALRVLSPHERTDAPRLIGRVLLDAGRDVDAIAFLRHAQRRFRSADDWASLAGAAGRADHDAVAVEAGRRAIQLGSKDPALLISLARSLYRMGEFLDCERVAQQLIAEGSRDARVAGLHAMARALAGQGRHVDAHPYAKAAAELGPNGELAADLIETMDRIVAQQAPPVRPSLELSPERQACADLEAGRFETLAQAIDSPSWGVALAALAACEHRTDDESGIPVSPRAIDGAIAILARSRGRHAPRRRARPHPRAAHPRQRLHPDRSAAAARPPLLARGVRARLRRAGAPPAAPERHPQLRALGSRARFARPLRPRARPARPRTPRAGSTAGGAGARRAAPWRGSGRRAPAARSTNAQSLSFSVITAPASVGRSRGIRRATSCTATCGARFTSTSSQSTRSGSSSHRSAPTFFARCRTFGVREHVRRQLAGVDAPHRQPAAREREHGPAGRGADLERDLSRGHRQARPRDRLLDLRVRARRRVVRDLDGDRAARVRGPRRVVAVHAEPRRLVARDDHVGDQLARRPRRRRARAPATARGPARPPDRARTRARGSAPIDASCAAARSGSAAAPIDRPHTRANAEPGGSSAATAPGALNVTSPGREYANRSSGRVRATSSLSAGSRPGRHVANTKSGTVHT